MTCITCHRTAQYMYVTVDGLVQPLCAVHARRLLGSVNLHASASRTASGSSPVAAQMRQKL